VASQAQPRQLFDLPFNKPEEQTFVSYLRETGSLGNKLSQNLLVLFLANRNRHLEALQEHEFFIRKFPFVEVHQARKIVIENLKGTLPRVQQALLNASRDRPAAARTRQEQSSDVPDRSLSTFKKFFDLPSIPDAPPSSEAPTSVPPAGASVSRPLTSVLALTACGPKEEFSSSFLAEVFSTKQISGPKSPSATGSQSPDYIPLASPPPSPSSSPNRRRY